MNSFSPITRVLPAVSLVLLTGCQPWFVRLSGVEEELKRKVNMDVSCPSLSGTFVRTPTVDALTRGHPIRHEGDEFDFIQLLLGKFAGSEYESQVGEGSSLSVGIDRILLTEKGSNLDLVRASSTPGVLMQTRLSSELLRTCDAEGFRPLPEWKVVGWGDGSGANDRYLTQVGRADNGDLVVFRVIVPDGAFSRSGIGQAYVARFQQVQSD